MEPTFLPGVENHPQPSPYTDLIRSMQAAGSEYMQIWHLFAFKPEMTAHLARFSQAVMRDPAPLSPYVDGLATLLPENPSVYRDRAGMIARHGYMRAGLPSAE